MSNVCKQGSCSSLQPLAPAHLSSMSPRFMMNAPGTGCTSCQLPRKCAWVGSDTQLSAATQQHAVHRRQGQDPQRMRSHCSSAMCDCQRVGDAGCDKAAAMGSPAAHPQPTPPAQALSHFQAQLPPWPPHLQPRGVVCLEDGQHAIVTVGAAAKHTICRHRHLGNDNSRAQQQAAAVEQRHQDTSSDTVQLPCLDLGAAVPTAQAVHNSRGAAHAGGTLLSNAPPAALHFPLLPGAPTSTATLLS